MPIEWDELEDRREWESALSQDQDAAELKAKYDVYMRFNGWHVQMNG